MEREATNLDGRAHSICSCLARRGWRSPQFCTVVPAADTRPTSPRRFCPAVRRHQPRGTLRVSACWGRTSRPSPGYNLAVRAGQKGPCPLRAQLPSPTCGQAQRALAPLATTPLCAPREDWRAAPLCWAAASLRGRDGSLGLITGGRKKLGAGSGSNFICGTIYWRELQPSRRGGLPEGLVEALHCTTVRSVDIAPTGAQL